MDHKKRIGVLTSGGDSPAMNAAIRAVVLSALSKGYEVLGIKEGYKGLVYDNMQLLFENDVDNIIERSGTILYSDRCLEFNTREGLEKARDNCLKNNITGLVCIGGDGTFRGATEFSQEYGINCIGLPGTIDNDITATDYTIGFDTAVNTVVSLADNLRSTCNSHRRCDVIEVMGRAAGDIALHAAVASGAQAVLLKEMNFDREKDFARIAAHLDEERKAGKRNFLVIVAEGVRLDLEGCGTVGEDLVDYINYNTGDICPETEAQRAADPTNKKLHRPDFIETKFARLAHIVRGGIPTMRDRVMASQMGELAVELLHDGQTDKVVCIRDNRLLAEDIGYALALDTMYKLHLNAYYHENGLLNAEQEAKYRKNIDRLAQLTRGYDADKLAQMEKFCAEKLAGMRKFYQTACTIS